MANSRIGNYQVEFALGGWTNPIRTHVHNFFVAPTATPATGELPANIRVQLLGGGDASLPDAVGSYMNFLRNLYPSSVTMGSWTLWRFATQYQRDFITSGIHTTTTAGTGSLLPGQQFTQTFRTAGGSILKLVNLEGSYNAGNLKLQVAGDAGGDALERYVAFVVSAGSPIIGIDNTFPIQPLFSSFGENESLFRKLYRS